VVESTIDCCWIRAVAGDVGALEALMSRHSGESIGWRTASLRNQADAEEIVQDVFLTLCRKGGGFEGHAALTSWMYRVTTNVALNKRRGKRRELEVSLEEHLPTTRGRPRGGDRSYVLADWSSTPEQAHLSVETRKILENAIDGLPDHYRAVLILRDVEELSNEEVASIVDDSLAR
jgi:RNA polymerase sigma-70 factor (ECF subfamily)